MATQSSTKPSKSADATRESPAEAPEETTLAEAPAAEAPFVEATVAEALAVESSSVEALVIDAAPPAPAAAMVEVVATPLAVVEKMVESTTEAFSVSFEFDAAAWSRKSFELWTENANAFLDLAGQIAKAKTFDEVVGLQSRFANERLGAFLRQSKEFMSFAQSMAAAPLCDAGKAA